MTKEGKLEVHTLKMDKIDSGRGWDRHGPEWPGEAIIPSTAPIP